MDDLRSTLAGFDPDAPLPGAPDPWDFMPTPAARPGPPWAMAEMIAAEPGLADRDRRARWSPTDRPTRWRRRPRGAAAAREPVVVTGCGTSEHAAMAVAAILRDAWRAAGLRRARAGRGPGVRAGAGSAGGRRSSSGISHEGGDDGDDRRDGRGAGRGARTALITGSAASPAAAAADVVARDGRDGPQLVPHGGLRVADRRRGGGRRRALAGGSAAAGRRSGARVADGIEAAHAPRPDGSRPRRGHRGDDRRRDAPARRRHRRRPGHRARARAQGRGGVVGPVGGARPRDVPPRPPARRRAPRPRWCWSSPSGPASTRGPSAPARRSPRPPRLGHRAGRDPGRGRRGRAIPARLTPGAADRRPGGAGPAAPRRRRPARRRRAAPARHARRSPRPAARTPTRSAATTRATSGPPSSPTTRAADGRRGRGGSAEQRLRREVDHLEVAGQEVLEHDPLDAGRLERRPATRAPGRACRGSSGRAAASNHASPDSASPNADRSAVLAARGPRRRSRPMSSPTIAEWVIVDGSRPAARQRRRRAPRTSAWRPVGLADDRLNSSA